MKVLAVIPSQRYRHISGRTASIYGACPWTSQADKANWTLETSGWTWEMDNGTIGLGRVPAKTRAEAIEVMNAINNR